MTQTSDINNLHREYGTTKATPAVGGSVRGYGDVREIVFDLDLTALTQSENVVIDTVFVPSGFMVKEVEIFTETAAATGTAIDLGLIRRDRTTELDYNGLLAAFPTASMNAAGETNIIRDNTTYDGALIGTTLAYDGLLTCSMTDATAFTAGALKIWVRFYKP